MKLIGHFWMFAMLVVGAWLVWQIGVKRESVMGALFGMFLTIGGVVIIEPSVTQQLSVLMVGLAIGLLILAFILMGWLWNVMAIANWRRARLMGSKGEVRSMDEWIPWLAWYPVKTERGSAWMRFVQVRLNMGAMSGSGQGLEFREVPLVNVV